MPNIRICITSDVHMVMVKCKFTPYDPLKNKIRINVLSYGDRIIYEGYIDTPGYIDLDVSGYYQEKDDRELLRSCNRVFLHGFNRFLEKININFSCDKENNKPIVTIYADG